MKMSLSKIIQCLIVLTALLDYAAQAQTPADQPKRREGEIWFEPTKAEVGGQVFEGERGHLIVRENRKNLKSNLIELVFIRCQRAVVSRVVDAVVIVVGITGVTDLVAVLVRLIRVGNLVAVVARVTDSIAVTIRLIRVGCRLAIIASVAISVGVHVRLIRV